MKKERMFIYNSNFRLKRKQKFCDNTEKINNILIRKNIIQSALKSYVQILTGDKEHFNHLFLCLNIVILS